MSLGLLLTIGVVRAVVIAMETVVCQERKVMREIAEFRVDERFAPMLFSDGEGKRLKPVTKEVAAQFNQLFRDLP